MERILIINNDFDTMSLLKGLLERNGYEAQFTGRREEVRQLVREFKPDLILMDVMQQGVIDDINSDPAIHKVPVLLMTGYNRRYDLPTKEPFEYIPKPFTTEELVNKLKGMNIQPSLVSASH